MIEHMVILKLKDTSTQKQINELMVAIMHLKDVIPGIIDVTCGANFSSIARGFTHGVVIRFIDHASLQGYFPHPAHTTMVEQYLKPILEDGFEVDYEIQ